MTIKQIILEAEQLNDEELDTLSEAINNIKCSRDYIRKDDAMEKLREAWNTVIDLGISIYDNEGNAIRIFDDFEWSF